MHHFQVSGNFHFEYGSVRLVHLTDFLGYFAFIITWHCVETSSYIQWHAAGVCYISPFDVRLLDEFIWTKEANSSYHIMYFVYLYELSLYDYYASWYL